MSDVTYRLVIAVCRALFRALGLRITVRGAEHLPGAGGAVLASNHVSFLDFSLVGLVGFHRRRFVRFLTKQSVFRPPVVGAAMRAMGHVSVDRAHGAVALRHAVEKARAGEVVGVFPEATISRSWTLKDFKPGAAAIAIWEQVPLIPVVVWGGQRVLTAGGRWSLRRGKALTILVGKPMHPAPEASPDEVTAELRVRLQALLDEAMSTYPDRPRNHQDRWWLPVSAGGSAPRPAAAAGKPSLRGVGTAKAARIVTSRRT